ncbi:TPA: hypothetical protein DCR49_07390 [Candidatus Delongbacteria bacterium]|nr:hypothetical protein [Candidatus Delongbacteria bacterium]
MKILFIIDSLCKGGKERRLLELLKGLKNRNIVTELILLTDQIEFDEIYDLNLKIHILKRKIKKDPSIFFKINNICKEFKPDIINSWGLMPSVYGAPVAKFRKIVFVNSMIVNAPAKLDMKTRFYSGIVFPLSDIIVGNSNAGLKSYGVQNSKGRVIYNGYDFSRSLKLADKDTVKSRWGITTRFVCGMVAGFRYHKDYGSLIQAAKIIISKRDDVSFIFVGDGPTLEESKNSSKDFNKIIFTGRQSDVESIINIFDIGILSTYTEGISNSIMEYMALNKPVIATDGGGTKEIVEDGVTGLLVPQRSPQILAVKIDYMLNDTGFMKEAGEKGKRKVVEKFSIDRMVVDYINLYKEKINN